MSERDLLNWALMIVAAEEAARRMAEGVRVEVKPVEVKPTSTHVVEKRNVVLEGEKVIVQTTGCGVLQEFMAKAESTDFQILIEKDGETAIHGSYSEYAEISQDVEEIDAFAERDPDGVLTGAYVFRVSNIEFTESLTVIIKTTKPVKFRAIFCKYKTSHS